jgi:thioredoxin 1
MLNEMKFRLSEKKYFLLIFVIILSLNILAQDKDSKPKVTFVELGSVNCIPCKQMQPILKSIEEKYGEQIKVVFYDVWKDDQKKYAQQYGIKLIPTQVFLDVNGKEFFRHEGFYPEAEIDKLLQGKGLKPKSNKG